MNIVSGLPSADTSAEPLIVKNTITLNTSWTDAGNDIYTKSITISGSTANSKIDLQFTASQIQQLLSDGVNAMYVDNDNNSLTVYAVGAAPTAAMTIQCTLTEVTS